jgi:hypothetical protein
MSFSPLALFVSLGVCAAGLALSCEDTSPPVPCVNAPPGGCPEDFGADVCADPSCREVYVCKDGNWVFSRACGARDGSAETSSPADAGILVREASGSDEGSAAIDAPAGSFGGPGCVALQEPDCPVGVALACMSSDCCGCQDLFLCADGGWNSWGVCADGSAVPR